MYTIIVTRKSGGHTVTVTDDMSLVEVIVNYCKGWSTARKIQILYPSHQFQEVWTWHSGVGAWKKETYDSVDITWKKETYGSVDIK